MIEAMSPAEKAQLSADWLARFHASADMDPWVHGFRVVRADSGVAVGACMFKGPPVAGVVEIAYGIDPDQQGKGYATEAARALVDYARKSGAVSLVIAHTLPESTASQRVLAKCGFRHVGEVMDPEDGLVWRFEKAIGEPAGIRKARPDEAAALSALASESKAHWGYSAEALAKWRPELNITPEDILRHPTFVAAAGERVVGFYMLHLGPPQTIEHLWVHPGSLRRGVGTLLIRHALAPDREGRGAIRVVSDPHAAGFYEHHGGIRTDSVSAPLPGVPDRILPVYEFS